MCNINESLTHLCNSLPIKGNQIGEMFKLGWLIELLEHNIYAAVIQMLYLSTVSTSLCVCVFQYVISIIHLGHTVCVCVCVCMCVFVCKP
jgi:hypothetical protein